MIYLCSPEYIKNNLIPDSNIDDRFILQSIHDAQEIDIQSIIGTKFLKTLKTQVDTNTLTTANKDFLDNYLRPTIARYALCYLPLYLNARFTAQGIVKKKTESGEVFDFTEIDKVREELRNLAEFYAQRMLRFLIANKTTYSDYLNVDDISQMLGKLNAYTSTSLNISGAQHYAEDISRIGLPVDSKFWFFKWF